MTGIAIYLLGCLLSVSLLGTWFAWWERGRWRTRCRTAEHALRQRMTITIPGGAIDVAVLDVRTVAPPTRARA